MQHESYSALLFKSFSFYESVDSLSNNCHRSDVQLAAHAPRFNSNMDYGEIRRQDLSHTLVDGHGLHGFLFCS